MVAEPGSVGAAGETLEPVEMFSIERLGRAEVHGDAMLDDFVLFEDLVEDFERAAAVAHEIFADDLEPVAGWFFRKDVRVVRDAKAEAYAEIGEAVETIGGHNCFVSR